jgi:glycosyltransferase involved in cell wall biosynthesis
MVLVVILSGALYLIIIGLFYRGWIKTSFCTTSNTYPNIKVSVIIPLRNESAHIQDLFQGLSNQDYPSALLEIIIVNDHSTDNSFEIANKFALPSFVLINLPAGKEGKKAALLEGTKQSSGELIITTDADCIPGAVWIKAIASYYEAIRPKMIVAPVALNSSSSIFSKFQELEFLSLQGSTAGAIAINRPIMCNGANLAFAKECLPIIQNTYANTQSASGDDIFALIAIKKKFPGQVHYLKSTNAIVKTNWALTIKSFFAQRKRWTVKARFYTDPFLIGTACTILFINLLLLFLLILSVCTNRWELFISLYLLKSIIDLPFLYNICSFFGSKKLMQWFPVFQSFYFLYISVTFALSVFGGYTWKSRKIRI